MECCHCSWPRRGGSCLARCPERSGCIERSGCCHSSPARVNRRWMKVKRKHLLLANLSRKTVSRNVCTYPSLQGVPYLQASIALSNGCDGFLRRKRYGRFLNVLHFIHVFNHRASCLLAPMKLLLIADSLQQNLMLCLQFGKTSKGKYLCSCGAAAEDIWVCALAF